MTYGTAALSILAVGFDQSPPHPPPSHPPLAPVAPECDGSCLFISEYVEPADSSQDGFLELYNGCDGPVNLREYSLLLCHDGCASTEGSAGGSGGIPPSALPISLATNDVFIYPGSLFSIVYCETVHTSRCANHNLVSLASSYFGDLGDGNGACNSHANAIRIMFASAEITAPFSPCLRLVGLVPRAVGVGRRSGRSVRHVHGGARLGCGWCGRGDTRPSPDAQVRHLTRELW